MIHVNCWQNKLMQWQDALTFLCKPWSKLRSKHQAVGFSTTSTPPAMLPSEAQLQRSSNQSRHAAKPKDTDTGIKTFKIAAYAKCANGDIIQTYSDEMLTSHFGQWHSTAMYEGTKTGCKKRMPCISVCFGAYVVVHVYTVYVCMRISVYIYIYKYTCMFLFLFRYIFCENIVVYHLEVTA